MSSRSAIPIKPDHSVKDEWVYLYPDGSRIRDVFGKMIIEREYIKDNGDHSWYLLRRYCDNNPINHCYGCGELFYFEDTRYRCCSEECRKETQLRHGRESITIHNIARSNRLQLARDGMKCLHCGNTIILTETNRKRYCNASCKQAAYRQRTATSR